MTIDLCTFSEYLLKHEFIEQLSKKVLGSEHFARRFKLFEVFLVCVFERFCWLNYQSDIEAIEKQHWMWGRIDLQGREVEVTVKNGAVYHGILYTMSERGEIVLKCVHRILGPNEDASQAVTNPSKSTLEDFIAFTSDLIVQMVCKNASLQPPTGPHNNTESSTSHNKTLTQNHGQNKKCF